MQKNTSKKMTLESAKRILEELPQDKSDRFNYRMKNYTLVHEAEAVCRGGFTFCEQTEERGRVYVWVKVFPTETDAESSIDLALKEYRKKKDLRNRKNQINKEQTSSPIPVLQQKLVIPQIVKSEQKGTNSLLSIKSKIKRKFDEFVKVMDEIVDE